MAFAPDSLSLASGSYDNTIILWRTEDGMPLRTLTGAMKDVLSVAFSPDGSWLAAGDNFNLRLWQPSDGQLRQTLGGLGESQSVAFSPDGTLVAGQNGSKLVTLWRTSDGSLVRTITGLTTNVIDLGFSPDSASLVVGTADFVRVYRISDGTIAHTLDASAGLSVGFTPDGTSVVAVVDGGGVTATKIWHADDGMLLRTFIEPPSQSPSVMAVSPDGAVLATGFNGGVHLWRLDDGASLTALDSAAGINDLAFSPDGARLAAASELPLVKVWCRP